MTIAIKKDAKLETKAFVLISPTEKKKNILRVTTKEADVIHALMRKK